MVQDNIITMADQ